MILFELLGHGPLYIHEGVNNYSFCDESGFRAYPGELVRRWDGMWVLPEFDEPEPYPEMRIRPSRITKGPLRPDDTRREVFVDDLYPDGVSTDDL